MPGYVLLFGIGGFLSAVCIQILIWNVREISGSIRLLIIVLIGFPSVGIGLLVTMNLMLWVDAIGILILVCLLSSAYIQSYPVFQEDIPSFRIMLFIRDFSGTPVSQQVIIDQLATDDLFVDKLQDLIDDGLIIMEGGNLILTTPGKLLVGCFSTYRRWLGLERGKG